MQISRYKGVKAETGKYPTWKNGEQTSSDERICQNPYNCKTKLSEMLRLKNVYFFELHSIFFNGINSITIPPKTQEVIPYYFVEFNGKF